MLHDVPTMLGGRYRVVERLGRGGMADVYRAEDVVLRRMVAIKIFRGGVEREAHLARFRAEVRTLAALTHPHLVALYDAGGDVTEPWCAMEYVNGGSLSDREGALPPDSVARIGEQIASGLAYVHSLGIVHRDVKPSNVLMDRGGDAFLSDFGIAKLVDGTRMTQSGLMIGTAAFLSPEQVRGRTAGPRADIYALGLVLLEALTGRREYPGGPVESAVARLSRSPEIPEDLGTDWGELLRTMTSEDPEDRPAPEEARLSLRAIARRLAGLDSIDLLIDLTGEPTAHVVDGTPTPEAVARGAGRQTSLPDGARVHGAVLFVPKAGPTALPRPIPLAAIETAARTATTEAGRTATTEAGREATPVPTSLIDIPVQAPRNLLAWLSPERRRRGQMILSGIGVVAIVALALPLADRVLTPNDPLRIDSAAGAGATGTSSAQSVVPTVVEDEGQSFRKAPVGVLLPPLPSYDPAPSQTRESSRRWPRGNGRVAGTATTRTAPRSGRSGRSGPSSRPGRPRARRRRRP